MRLVFLAPLLASLLTGCIVNVAFDPVGSDSSMQGSWTVAGAVPTVESCGEIRFVRVRFFEGDDHRDHSELVFDCAAGAFDTRPGEIIADGVWTVALVGVRADGSVVEAGLTTELDTGAEGGRHLTLPSFDFTGGG